MPQLRSVTIAAVMAVLSGGAAIAAAASAHAHTDAGPAAPAALPILGAVARDAAFAPGRLLVKFRSGVDGQARAATLHGVGATDVGSIPDLGVHVLSVAAGAELRVAAALTHSGKTDFAERDGIVRGLDVAPNDPSWPSQWGPKKIGTPAAWSTSTGSSSVVVAVLDSGLSTSLAEFAGRVMPGYNFVSGTTNVTDDNGHGTEVTGVALAQGNNSTALAGMCWTCSVLPVKVLNSSAVGTDSAAAAGITWAADHGAKVINLSFGSATPSSAQASAVSYAESKGALVVAAAGNNSSGSAFYPAADPGVLSVAASDQFDNLYSYSDYGSWVDVAAPGSNYTVAPSGSSVTFGGTSSASPVVAGLAGLLFSAKPSATPAEVSAAISQTTNPLSGGTVATGRVDAAAAMTALAGSPPAPASSTTTSTPTSTPTTVSPSPTSTTATPTPTSTPPTTSPPAAVTTSFSGTVQSGASKSYALTTSGGTVSATVSGTSAPVSLALVRGGTVVATASGASGTTVSATLAAGSFTVEVRSSGAKTRFTMSVTYFS